MISKCCNHKRPTPVPAKFTLHFTIYFTSRLPRCYTLYVPRPDPFSGPPPEEIPLARAPLPLVVAQVTFPTVAGFTKLESIAPFQAALMNQYPILRPEPATSFVIGPKGIQIQAGEGKIWRFHDKGNKWRVSLTTEFVALETRSYEGRQDFIERFRAILAALQQAAKPAVYERLGVRFSNRLRGNDVDALPRLVHPELLGIVASRLSAKLVHSVCETSFTIGDDALNVRWGLLPPGGTPDPAAIEPMDEPTWLLDMDAFTSKSADFSTDAVADKAVAFASRIYSFFRWAVTDEFLSRFGGTR